MLEFTFNGQSCKNFGLYVQTSNHLNSFEKNIESIKVPGRTGNLLIDDGSYKNKIIEIECLLKADFLTNENISLYQASVNISNWLKNHKGYKPLIFNDGANFNAVCINQIEFEKLINNFASVLITFDAEGKNINELNFKKGVK